MTVIYALVAIAAAFAVGFMFRLNDKVNRLEISYADRNASVAKEVIDLKDRLAKIEVKLDADYIEMEEHIADRIEKKWDDGLQSILNFNPFTKEGNE